MAAYSTILVSIFQPSPPTATSMVLIYLQIISIDLNIIYLAELVGTTPAPATLSATRSNSTRATPLSSDKKRKEEELESAKRDATALTMPATRVPRKRL
jgi:hypothetical protein